MIFFINTKQYNKHVTMMYTSLSGTVIQFNLKNIYPWDINFFQRLRAWDINVFSKAKPWDKNFFIP